MVTLPRDFVATSFPGYFWNITEQKLYSLKIGGVLKPLKGPYKPNHWNNWDEPKYSVTHRGRRRNLRMSYLEKLEQRDSVIPVDRPGGIW